MADTIVVPMTFLSDGRPFITDEACAADPAVRAFVARFPEAWHREPTKCGWVNEERLDLAGLVATEGL